MKKLFLNLGALVLLALPITSILLLFEIVTLPYSHRYDGYFVAGYLSLVLVLLTREILLSLLSLLGWRRDQS